MQHPHPRHNTIIVYGSYGYTGKLIVEELKATSATDVILAGRNEKALQQQSQSSGYSYEVVDVQDKAMLKKLLLKGNVLIHCAGPFKYTAAPLAELCLETQTHYTDITGEYEVFEQLAGFNARAIEAGIQIMPGTGFDVVPSDCLALHLKNRLPSATHLQLAFASSKGGFSRGTAKTMIEGLGEGSTIRKNGKLVNIPSGSKVKEINFGPFTNKAANIPWGDIATAYRSTGIPNIEVYMAAPEKMIRQMRISQYFGWLLRQRWVKKLLMKQLDKRPAGPSEKNRQTSRSYLWGEVWDDAGKRHSSRLETLNGYTLTAKAAVAIAQKILAGNYKPGYQTPATAYGADLILEMEKSERVDVD